MNAMELKMWPFQDLWKQLTSKPEKSRVHSISQLQQLSGSGISRNDPGSGK